MNTQGRRPAGLHSEMWELAWNQWNEAQPRKHAEDRSQHLQGFLNAGLPSRQDENWRQTPLRQLDKLRPRIPSSREDHSNLSIAALRSYLAEIFGQLSPESRQSAILIAQDGKFVTSPDLLRALGLQDADTVLLTENETRESAFFNHKSHSLEHLRAAFSEPKECVISATSKPRQLLFLNLFGLDGLQGPNTSAQELTIRVCAGAEIEVLEVQLDCSEEISLRTLGLNILLEHGAICKKMTLQDCRQESHLITNTRVFANAQSQFQHLALSSGSGLIRNELEIKLAGPHAEAQIDGFYHPIMQGLHDHHTHVEHVFGETTSSQVYHGILEDKSRAVFNGRVVIHEGADQSSAHQLNKNLLLSQDAHVHTKPELQIHADDVSCSHGATTGSLSADEIFYLRSRCLSEAAARELICQGFAMAPALRDFPSAFLIPYRNWALAQNKGMKS